MVFQLDVNLIHDGHFGSASDAEAWKCRRCASSRLSASIRREENQLDFDGLMHQLAKKACLLDPFTMPWCDFPWPFPPKHVARMGRDSIGYSGYDVPCYVYIMVWRTLQCSLHGGVKFPLCNFWWTLETGATSSEMFRMVFETSFPQPSLHTPIL